MSFAIGNRTCSVVGCHRAVMTTAHGRVVYGRCPAHTALAQTQAFADSPSSPASRISPSVGVRDSAGSRVAAAAVSTSG